MTKECHRCGSPLASPENFCPSCGAPQLLYEQNTDDADSSASSGAAVSREMQWKPAIGAALTFAVPVGLLCSSVIPALSGGCCLWVLGGAIASVFLYQRRSATHTLPRAAGRRIGAIVGIMAAAVAAAFNAGATVFQRYVLHQGDAMDKSFQTMLEQSSAASAQLMNGFFSNPSLQTRDTLQLWLSPDGRAAFLLMTVLMWSAGITIFSMIGGALGTRLVSGRNPSLRNS